MLKPFIWLYIFSIGIFGILINANGFVLFLTLFASPFILMIPIIILKEKQNIFSAFGRCFSIGKNSYGDSLGSLFVLMLITIIFFLFLLNPVAGFLDVIQSIVREFTITVTDYYNVIIALVASIIFIVFIIFILSLIFISIVFCYYSASEKETAAGLYERLDQFGKRSRTVENALDFE